MIERFPNVSAAAGTTRTRAAGNCWRRIMALSLILGSALIACRSGSSSTSTGSGSSPGDVPVDGSVSAAGATGAPTTAGGGPASAPTVTAAALNTVDVAALSRVPGAELVHQYADVLGSGEVMLDDTWVYFSNGDALWRARKDGTTAVREKMGPNGMRNLTPALGQDADHVYWVEEHHLVIVGKSTLEVTTLEFEGNAVGGGSLIVDGGVAYVAEPACRGIAKVPLNGDAAVIWETAPDAIAGVSTTMVADESSLYCGVGTSRSDFVVQVDRETGKSEQFVAPTPAMPRLSGIGGLALDSANFYWVEQVTSGDDGPIFLYRQAKTNGKPERLMTLPTGTTNHTLVLRGRTLYWDSAGLNRYDLDAGEYRYLSQYLSPTQDFAIDDGFVYWTIPGHVLRVNLAGLEAAPEPEFLFTTRQVPKDQPVADGRAALTP